MTISHVLIWLVLGISVLAVGLGGWRLLDRPIQSVSIDGLLTEAENQDVQRVVKSRLPESMLRLDIDALSAQIHDLSWPDRVRIRRVWPASLAISISKPSVVARWRTGGVLTSRGEVVFMNDPMHAELPVLSAEVSTPAASMNRFEALNSLLGDSLYRLTSLHQDNLGEWRVTLDDKVMIKLGARDTLERFRRALLVYNQARKQNPTAEGEGIAALDARYQNGVAVSWLATAEQLVAYGQ